MACSLAHYHCKVASLTLSVLYATEMPGGCGGSAKAFAEITPDTHLESLSSLSASVAHNIKKLSNPFKIVADTV